VKGVLVVCDDFWSLIHAIRDEMEGYIEWLVRSNPRFWNKFCAALDAIEDSQLAIEAYCEYDYPSDIKGGYLFTYGLLQAFFVQQDAAKSINHVLKNIGKMEPDKEINYKESTEYQEVYAIRELRNNTVGHPMDRLVQISQATMGKSGFEYYLYDEKKDYVCELKVAHLDDAIQKQQEGMVKILNDALMSLKVERRKHAEKFIDKKIVSIFDQLYFIREKALCDPYMEHYGIEQARSMVEQCKNEVAERYGEWNALPGYEQTITEIEDLFHITAGNIAVDHYDDPQKVKYYLLELLFMKIEELRDMCQETDDQFCKILEDEQNESLPSQDEHESIEIIFNDLKDEQ